MHTILDHGMGWVVNHLARPIRERVIDTFTAAAEIIIVTDLTMIVRHSER